MKSKLIAAALMAGLASPAAASTVLDFTSSAIGAGSPSGSVGVISYSITGNAGLTSGPGLLTDSTHKNNVDCTGQGWDFACDAVGDRFDVGLGVSNRNANEIDGIDDGEYVQVEFDRFVRVFGFAGMLTYDDSQASGGIVNVVLEYSIDGVTWGSVVANALRDDNDPGNVGDNVFGTVGLAYASGLDGIIANVVRFRAGGTSPFDDRTANVTAAGLDIAAVPVPAALPLMLAGMGAFGWAARRKKRMVA